MSEWISVENRLPEVGSQVWVSFVFPRNERGEGYSIYRGANDWFFDVTQDGDLWSRSSALREGEHYVAAITHWMPLPEPPK